MDILTDELITKAAVAIVDKRFDVINGRVPTEHEVAQLYARAALQAVLPDVVEKCAQALINSGCAAPADYNWSAGWDAAVENGAHSIRSLLNKEDGNG